MDIRKQFARNLTNLMKAKGKRQQDLMDELGYSSSTLSQWCTGKNMPKPSRVESLAKYFGVSVDTLYAGADPVGGDDAEKCELKKRLSDIESEFNALRAHAMALQNDNDKLVCECAEIKKNSVGAYKRLIEVLRADGAKEIVIKF